MQKGSGYRWKVAFSIITGVCWQGLGFGQGLCSADGSGIGGVKLGIQGVCGDYEQAEKGQVPSKQCTFFLVPRWKRGMAQEHGKPMVHS